MDLQLGFDPINFIMAALSLCIAAAQLLQARTQRVPQVQTIFGGMIRSLSLTSRERVMMSRASLPGCMQGSIQFTRHLVGYID